VAYETWPESVRPGEALGVTLLWRVLGPLDRNYTLGVHLLGEGQTKVGETNVYPGRGNYATTLWRAGDLLRETYWVTVREPITRPVMGRVKVAFFLDDHTQAHLPVTDAHGNPLGEAVVFGRFKLAPTAPTAEPTSVSGLALLGETIRLSEATWPGEEALLVAGDAFTVTLTWDVLGRPPADYTVFLHLEGPTGPAAYGDGPPAGGAYPTGLWDRGERIVDRHVVRLPPEMPAGEYALVTGLYDARGQRVIAHGPDGERLPADQILLDHVTVVRRDRRHFIPLILQSENHPTWHKDRLRPAGHPPRS